MNQSHNNILKNHYLFKLVFNLVDSSQQKEFNESLEVESSDWTIEIYKDYYLLIGRNPITLVKTIHNLGIIFNLDIKILTTNYIEIPSQVSCKQSLIFSNIKLNENYQLSYFDNRVSIQCIPLSSKTTSLVEKLPFEKTPNPVGIRYKKFSTFHSNLLRLRREAESLNLSISGNKDELISRLHNKLQADTRYYLELNLIYDSLKEQGIQVSKYVSGIFKYKSNIFIINTNQQSLDDFPLGQAELIYESIYTSLENFCQSGPISQNEVCHTAFLLNTFIASKHIPFLRPEVLVPLFKSSMEVSMRCSYLKLCVPYFYLANQKYPLSGDHLCKLISKDYQHYQESDYHFSHWETLDSDPFNPETKSGSIVKNLLDSKNIVFPKNLKELLESLNNYKFRVNDESYKGICIY